MSKISSINRTSSIQAFGATHQSTLTKQRVVLDALRRRHLYLVPRQAPQPPLPSRIARYRRLLREHPYLVDAAFVAVTLSMATILWLCGW